MRHRAFSLLESLFTLAVLAVLLFWLSPLQFGTNSAVLLENEADKIRAFLYRLQDKARFARADYSLSIAQRGEKWCLLAARKSGGQVACDCFAPAHCAAKETVLYPAPHPKVQLKTNKTYPAVFLELSGETGNNSATCLQLSAGGMQKILKIEGGIVSEYPEKNRSRCSEI